jgi:hypothetical protein
MKREEKLDMTIRIFILTIVIIQILSGCSEPSKPTIHDEITNDEYAALAAIVDTCYPYAKKSLIFLRDSTTSGVFFIPEIDTILAHVKQAIPLLGTDVVENYKTKNMVRMRINTPTSICKTCVFINKWFYDKWYYPEMSVSRVGFSQDGLQALAYVGFIGAPLYGEGCYYVLQRLNGKWTLTDKYVVWIT